MTGEKILCGTLEIQFSLARLIGQEDFIAFSRRERLHFNSVLLLQLLFWLGFQREKSSIHFEFDLVVHTVELSFGNLR
jgi:hypothetical protein